MPGKGQDYAISERPGRDRAEIAQRYERLERFDDAVRWYLEAADFSSAVGHFPAAYSWTRLALKVNPLDPAAREKSALLMAQLGLADGEA